MPYLAVDLYGVNIGVLSVLRLVDIVNIFTLISFCEYFCHMNSSSVTFLGFYFISFHRFSVVSRNTIRAFHDHNGLGLLSPLMVKDSSVTHFWCCG